MIRYSWILPVKNEAESLSQLTAEIQLAMTGKSYEIIAVDDASTDKTLAVLTHLTAKHSQLKIIRFKTPQGKWASLLAGFKNSTGQVIITSDSDLQDDPAQINKLLAKLDRGYDLTSGWRKIRFDPWIEASISKLGNWLASVLIARQFKDLNCPFKVYRRQLLENLPIQGSLLRFSSLFAYKLGYRVAEIPIIHRPRLYDKSKFGIVKYIRIIYDLIIVLLLFSGSGRVKRV